MSKLIWLDDTNRAIFRYRFSKLRVSFENTFSLHYQNKQKFCLKRDSFLRQLLSPFQGKIEGTTLLLPTRCFFNKHGKISAQTQICLQQYRLQGQNILLICLYDAGNGFQIQRPCFLIFFWVSEILKSLCQIFNKRLKKKRSIS